MYREILKTLCDHATLIAMRNGFDVDVADESILFCVLNPMKDYWWKIKSRSESFDFELKLHKKMNAFNLVNSLVSQYEFELPLFDSSIQEDAYRSIVESCTSHSSIKFKKNGHDRMKNRFEIYKYKVLAKISDIGVLRRDPSTRKLDDFSQKQIKHMQKKLDVEESRFNDEAFFSFQFAPTNARSIEEVKIWCDLNC